MNNESQQNEWPKPVLTGFPPIILWAHNEEELKNYLEEANRFLVFFERVLYLSLIGPVALFVWILFQWAK